MKIFILTKVLLGENHVIYIRTHLTRTHYDIYNTFV